jgi:hypothetical protein
MNEADLELLVNDALDKELRSEAGHRADGPISQPQMDCMSSSWKNSAFLELLFANVMRKDLRDAVTVGTDKNRQREEVIGDRNS